VGPVDGTLISAAPPVGHVDAGREPDDDLGPVVLLAETTSVWVSMRVFCTGGRLLASAAPAESVAATLASDTTVTNTAQPAINGRTATKIFID
jgi:hypothetical protein